MAEQQYIPKVNPEAVLMGYLGTKGADVGQLAGYLAGSVQQKPQGK